MGARNWDWRKSITHISATPEFLADKKSMNMIKKMVTKANEMSVAEFNRMKKGAKSKGLRIITKNKYLEDMKLALQLAGIPFELEFKFDENRKFRFDIYIEQNGKKIGIEYDGINSKKSRHTSITGFSKDQEKTNLAASNGIFVLRYTVLNYKSMIKDVRGMVG